LGKTRSLISGSVLTKVLTNCEFKPDDVDVYAPESSEKAMLQFLGTDLDFAMDHNMDMRYPDLIAVKKIWWFVKGTFKINLIIVTGENAAVAVFMFHSTPVMNFASYKGIFCAYPQLTFVKTGIANTTFLKHRLAATRSRQAFKKYEERG
ncbi:hypothetical protein DFH06DRAFT_911723, partial [Mycena polygramma]